MTNVNTQVTNAPHLTDSLNHSEIKVSNVSSELKNFNSTSEVLTTKKIIGATDNSCSKTATIPGDFKTQKNSSISRDVIPQHNTAESSWVIYEKSVCDITNYLNSNEHPGGSDVIKEFTGGDITDVFKEQGHSKYAEKILNSFKIGTVESELNDKNNKKVQVNKKAEVSNLDLNPHNDLDMIVAGVDFRKPLIYQIYKSTNSDYSKLISTHYISNKSCRLFGFSFLEVFTKTPWWVIPLIWVPVSITLFLFTMIKYSIPFERSLILYFFGIFIWSFAEYQVHRFIFHFAEDKLIENGSARVIHFLLHGMHHLFPSDPLRLVMPPALFIILCTPFYILTKHLITTSMLHMIWSGVVLGYVFYDVLHYVNHHGNVHNVLYLNFIKAYHLRHHFRQPTRGFGVTNPVWDHVFGTTFK